MQETILPPTTTIPPAMPERSTWQKLIRKPLTWIVVGAAIIGIAVALAVAGRPGADTPSSILKGDGYSVAMTLGHQQLVQAMNSGGGSTGGLNPGDYFTTAAAGVNGGSEEVVLGVTDQGKGLDGLLVGYLNQGGVHARTVDGGRFIVVSGSGSALGGLAGTGTTASGTSVE